MENLCECLYIYLNTHLVLKVFNVNILLAIFTSISPCLEFSIKCTYYIYRVGQLSFLSFFFFLINLYFAGMLDHIFLELIIESNWKMQFQSKWNLELSISINEIHLKINTVCQIIQKPFSKASVKERGKSEHCEL